MKPLTTCLWFDGEAEEAARFYTSVFKDGKIGRTTRYGKEGFEVHGRPAGSVMTVEFELRGQRFLGLNGGPLFKFDEAVSLVVNCADQEEIDYYWSKLLQGGGKESECGWLRDKFGFSWQVTPTILEEMMLDPDPVKSGRVMKALLEMKKLDVEALKAAYKG